MFVIFSGTIHSGKELLAYTLQKHNQVNNVLRHDFVLAQYFNDKFNMDLSSHDLLTNDKEIQNLIKNNPLSSKMLNHFDDNKVNIILTSCYTEERTYTKELFENNKIITFFRDPRIIWILNDHFNNKQNKEECLNFCDKQINPFFLDYYWSFKDFSDNLDIEFEQFLQNFDMIIKTTCEHIGIQYQKLDPISKIYNSYFTEFDINHKHFDKNLHSQQMLNLVTEKCSSLITYMKYPAELLLDDIFSDKNKNTNCFGNGNTVIISSLNHSGKTFFFKTLSDNKQLVSEEFVEGSQINGHSFYCDNQNEIFSYILQQLSDEDFFRLVRLPNVYGNNSKDPSLNLNEYCSELFLKYTNIIFVRDPRVVWMLNNHIGQKNKTDINACWEFINTSGSDGPKTYLEFIKQYCKNNPKSFVVRFEDYINDFQTISKQIGNYLNLELKTDLRASEAVNTYLTTADLQNVNLRYQQSQQCFDLISSECSKYIHEFGYKKNLKIDDVYINIMDKKQC